MTQCCLNDSPSPMPSRVPAHELWVELSTRIASQELHPRSGQEEAAVTSIVSLFATTRELMKKNPDGKQFLELAEVLLATLRPYTARWHGLQDAGAKFLGPPQRLQFRHELPQLQVDLAPLLEQLEQLATTGQCANIPPEPTPKRPILAQDVSLGIDLSHTPLPPLAAANDKSPPLSAHAAFELMNVAEQRHVAGRRGLDDGVALTNGAGLALSGGGIRSATFCLGVVEVLAEAKLLTRFDYLSTVSGGGYLGSFLSNQFTKDDVEAAAKVDANTAAAANAAAAAAAYDKVFTGVAAESSAVRHLRNSSKYLLPKTTLDRLKLVGLLISGVLATSLLTVAVPVFSAALVYLFERFGLLSDGANPFGIVAAVAGIVVGLCWLLRPITKVWRGWPGIDTAAAFVSLVAIACLIVFVTPHAPEFLKHHLPNWKGVVSWAGGLTTLVSGATVVKAMGAAWKYRKALSRIFILSGASLFVLVYLATFEALHRAECSGDAVCFAGLSLTPAELAVSLFLLLWLIWAACINLNLTGLHRYYRDRLASCYLENPKPVRDPPNPPLLQTLSPNLPYHLINTTVNLTSSENPELRGRGGDFFLLSRHVCGSTITGYRPTGEVSAMNSDLDLATAMAISGAAASTNMGWHTMHEYRTLMAIFNVRLGYWLRWRKEKGWLASNAFVQLTREIFGLLQEKASALNLSDGGHIENLGVYELIRRRMKFIVSVDGGLDGNMDCADLSRLQRLVAIDFGYRIEFDPADLKLQDRYSRGYGMLVKIDYTPAEKEVCNKQLGWMLYIKLAMLGTESNYVLDYRRENPLFPHQSTADQFFDEAQFEAYRKLGESAARSFIPPGFSAATRSDFEPLFLRLAANLLRDTDPVYVPR